MTSIPIALFGSASAIVAILTLLAVLLVIKRTRSIHVIAYRMWRWIHGNDPIADSSVRAFVDEQNSLMVFRFVSGLQVPTLSRVHEIIEKIKQQGIDVSDLRLAGARLKISGSDLRITSTPSKSALGISFALSVVIGVTGALATFGVFYDSALLHFKDHGPSFMMDQVEARVLGSDMSLWRSDCASKDISRREGFSKQQSEAICNTWLANPEFVPRTVSKQRFAFFALAGLCIFLLQHPLGAMTSGMAALRLKKKLSKPDSKTRKQTAG